MAIIVEAYGVIIKHSAAVRCFNSYKSLQNIIPNNTYVFNGDLNRITLMAPADIEAYVKLLKSYGFVHLKDGEYVDFAVVDMITGPMAKCPWLGFSRRKFFENMPQFRRCNEDFSIVWLLPPGRGYGIPCDENGAVDIASHTGWTPDNAIQDWHYLPEDKIDSQLIELNNNKGVKQYWYAGTGEVYYSGSPVIKQVGIISQIRRIWNRVIRKV